MIKERTWTLLQKLSMDMKHEPSSKSLFHVESDGWNITCAPCHHLKHCPGPWKESLTATWHPRKNGARQWDSFLKRLHKHMDQKAGLHPFRVHHIPYHAPASGKIEERKGLLKTALKAMSAGTFRCWGIYLAKATWLVSCRTVGDLPIKLVLPNLFFFFSFFLYLEGGKVCVVHRKVNK